MSADEPEFLTALAEIQDAMMEAGKLGSDKRDRLLRALRDAEDAGAHPRAAFLLSRFARPRSPLLAAIWQTKDEALGLRLALACASQLNPTELAKAHLNLTTEICGPATFAISMAVALAPWPDGLLPALLPRHGMNQSPWSALFADFAGEFTPAQAEELARTLARRCPRPPSEDFFEDFIEGEGMLDALAAAARGAPEIARDPGFAQAMNRLSAPGSFLDSRLGQATIEESFAVARQAGWNPCSHDPATFANPELAALVEAAHLAALSAPGAPRGPKRV